MRPCTWMDSAVEPSNLSLTRPKGWLISDAVTVAGTILAILAAALVPLLTPWLMHPVLDAARSADWLATNPSLAHMLSDRTVDELLFGPGTFTFAGPSGSTFYDPAEVAHLQDARQLLWLLFAAGVLAALGIAVAVIRSTDPGHIVRAIGLGGAATGIGVIVIGVVGLVAFDPLFELFHRVFFPGGNWAFDPRTERLVQLYPYAFWQIDLRFTGHLRRGHRGCRVGGRPGRCGPWAESWRAMTSGSLVDLPQ